MNENTTSVKSVNEISSLADLGLSATTLKIIPNTGMTIEGLVLSTRINFGGQAEKDSAWRRELAEALDQHGYIRHDFDEKSFKVGRLYKRIYGGNFVGKLQDFTANLMYEEYQNLSGLEVSQIVETIKRVLGPEESALILRRYELEDDLGSDAGKYYCDWLQSETEKAETEAIKKLREYKRMPFVFQFRNSALESRVSHLYSQLVKMHENPIFTDEVKIKKELLRISLSGKIDVTSLMPVEELGLSNSLCTKLKQAGYYTLGSLKCAPAWQFDQIDDIDKSERLELLDLLSVYEHRFF